VESHGELKTVAPRRLATEGTSALLNTASGNHGPWLREG
jgi:hypothetical protein